MKKIVSKVIAVMLAVGMMISAAPAEVNATDKETIKVPAKFKKAKELELGELIETKSSGMYYFDLKESSRVEIYTDNGPKVILFNQKGDSIAQLDTLVGVNYDDSSNYEKTQIYYLKSGRYYLTMDKHSNNGRDLDPRKKRS